MTVNLVSIYLLQVGLRDRFDPKNIRITCALYFRVRRACARVWNRMRSAERSDGGGKPKRDGARGCGVPAVAVGGDGVTGHGRGPSRTRRGTGGRRRR